MAKGLGLVVGLNGVDPSCYRNQWDGKLRFALSDAQSVADLLEARNIKTRPLLSEKATIGGLRAQILAAADELATGDLFVFFVSCHGNTKLDRSGLGDEERDQTLCLYDGQMLDDELKTLWPKFQPGVRVIMFADCCHSGSMTRSKTEDQDEDWPKAMPEDISKSLVRNDREFFSNLRQQLPTDLPDIQATVTLISGCQETQKSFENKPRKHGWLTFALLDAFKNGDFPGNNKQLRDYIAKVIKAGLSKPHSQTPEYLVIPAPNAAIESEPALSVG